MGARRALKFVVRWRDSVREVDAAGVEPLLRQISAERADLSALVSVEHPGGVSLAFGATASGAIVEFGDSDGLFFGLWDRRYRSADGSEFGPSTTFASPGNDIAEIHEAQLVPLDVAYRVLEAFVRGGERIELAGYDWDSS